MPIKKKNAEKNPKRSGADFFAQLWEKSWIYIKTVVDVVREPVLILDQDLRVMAANDAFYEAFQVKLKDTEDEIVYQLGDGQWDIPSLRKLLDDILAHNTFFKGFQVAHEFPGIGRKVILPDGSAPGGVIEALVGGSTRILDDDPAVRREAPAPADRRCGEDPDHRGRQPLRRGQPAHARAVRGAPVDRSAAPAVEHHGGDEGQHVEQQEENKDDVHEPPGIVFSAAC